MANPGKPPRRRPPRPRVSFHAQAQPLPPAAVRTNDRWTHAPGPEVRRTGRRLEAWPPDRELLPSVHAELEATLGPAWEALLRSGARLDLLARRLRADGSWWAMGLRLDADEASAITVRPAYEPLWAIRSGALSVVLAELNRAAELVGAAGAPARGGFQDLASGIDKKPKLLDGGTHSVEVRLWPELGPYLLGEVVP